MILHPILAAVLFSPLLGFSQDKAEKDPRLSRQAPAIQEKKTHKPSYPILNKVFKTGLNQDQIKTLGEHPTVEQQVAAMTQGQKVNVRQSLREVEAKAKTPEDLEQIARGYLILDERQEGAGQNAIRAASRLQELEPKSSVGFSLAAGGYYQMDDFSSAARAAKEALRRNPEDPNAITLLALSRDRVVERDTAGRAIEKSFSFIRRDDPNLPIKLPVKIPSKSAPVPAMMKNEPSTPRRRGPSPLLPLTVPVGVSLIGYGVYRNRQTKTSEAGLNPEPKSPPTPGAALTNTIIKAAIGATVIVGAGYLAAPYLPTVLSAPGRAAPALARSGAAGGAVALKQSSVIGVTRAGMTAGGTAAIAKKASDYYTYSKNEPSSTAKSDRNPSQDVKLTPSDIQRLKKRGIDVHELKGGKRTGQTDLYKDRAGNIYIKPRGGGGGGEPTGEKIP